MAGDSLVAYYGQRAHEYERIYQKPERQPDLRRLRGWLRDVLTEQRILEIACGTGYWTEAVAPVAAEITASTDAWVTERLWSWSTIGMWRGAVLQSAVSMLPGTPISSGGSGMVRPTKS